MENKEDIINKSINILFNNNVNNYIFIYTPPKVGSTTLVTSLRVSLGKSYNIIHIHDEIMLKVLTNITDVTINDIINYLAKNNKNIYVIDIYRTVIEKKISEFFEKISCYHFNNSENNINNYNISKVITRFNNVYPYIQNEDHYFDKYNISTPIDFDFEKKYTIQTINNIKYIKLRLCDSNSWNNILSNILETDIVIINDYETNNKPIKDLYNLFKQEYKLPINYYEDLKNNKYLKFYYSEKERTDYLNNWNAKLSGIFIPYTQLEYDFYLKLCLENQYINDVLFDHYIDNGCFCKYCSIKRRDIFFKAKKGENNFPKIIHNEVISQVITNSNQTKLNILKELVTKIKNKQIKNTTTNKTNNFSPRSFSITK